MSKQLDIDTSVCLHQQDLPLDLQTVWPDTQLPARLLRNTADGRCRSAIVRLEAGSGFSTETLDRPAIQIFVLEGALTVDGHEILANGFAVLGASSSVLATQDSSFILIISGPDAEPPAENTAFCIRDCNEIEPFVPVIDGEELTGFERRVLWLDKANGADTRLLKIPGGFSGVGPNWHPVNEEIFCIAGDIQPDDTRPMGPGSYLFNPANSIHGFNEKTDGGCVLLEWHDGTWDLITAAGAKQPV